MSKANDVNKNAAHEADAWISAQWMNKLVRQVSASEPKYQHNVGRESKVVETFWDENGALHLRTADMYWCPASLMEIIEDTTSKTDVSCQGQEERR